MGWISLPPFYWWEVSLKRKVTTPCRPGEINNSQDSQLNPLSLKPLLFTTVPPCLSHKTWMSKTLLFYSHFNCPKNILQSILSCSPCDWSENSWVLGAAFIPLSIPTLLKYPEHSRFLRTHENEYQVPGLWWCWLMSTYFSSIISSHSVTQRHREWAQSKAISPHHVQGTFLREQRSEETTNKSVEHRDSAREKYEKKITWVTWCIRFLLLL